MLETLTQDSFTPLLHTRFEVHAAGVDVVEVELVEVTGKKTAVTETFSLLFRGPLTPVFPHDTHTVRHPALGEFSLFLGPVHAAQVEGVCYQAIFNRFVS